MNKKELKKIYQDMKLLMGELEAAIYSDTESYTLDVDYEEVLNYYNDSSNAEEGL